MVIKFINRSVISHEKLGKFLSSIYGVSRTSSMKICKQLGVSYSIRIDQVSFDKLGFIETYFGKKLLALDLQRQVQTKLADKIRLGGYAGLRLSQNLPSRGQRTKTNAQTCKKKKGFRSIKPKVPHKKL
jgi:small subunit ribosomal protein S13